MSKVKVKIILLISVLSKFIYILLITYNKVESVSRLVVSNSLQPYGLEPTRLLCAWSSLGKNIGVGCHSLLQTYNMIILDPDLYSRLYIVSFFDN